MDSAFASAAQFALGGEILPGVGVNGFFLSSVPPGGSPNEMFAEATITQTITNDSTTDTMPVTASFFIPEPTTRFVGVRDSLPGGVDPGRDAFAFVSAVLGTTLTRPDGSIVDALLLNYGMRTFRDTETGAFIAELVDGGDVPRVEGDDGSLNFVLPELDLEDFDLGDVGPGDVLEIRYTFTALAQTGFGETGVFAAIGDPFSLEAGGGGSFNVQVGDAVDPEPPDPQHGHLIAGATGKNQGEALYFENGDDFIISSGYVKTLVWTNDGRYAGYFQGDITPTVLPATPDTGGPAPEAPALGSFIGMDLVSVTGPPGGFFGFWENGATEPTVSVSDQGTETDRWLLSESEGEPGTDPFGHIHGRRFTATLPGLYRVGFRLVDLSTNGVEAGPIHTPSELLYVHFQAGITITSVVHQAGSAAVSFGAPVDGSYALEYSTNLDASTGWTLTESTVLGDDHFQTLLDPDADGSTRFYRVRQISP